MFATDGTASTDASISVQGSDDKSLRVKHDVIIIRVMFQQMTPVNVENIHNDGIIHIPVCSNTNRGWPSCRLVEARPCTAHDNASPPGMVEASIILRVIDTTIGSDAIRMSDLSSLPKSFDC